jgi:hypothetical protein
MANRFREYADNNKDGKLLDKWDQYFEIYDRHFSRFKGTNPVIVEVGLFFGGSIDLWNHYFDGQCTIHGIDINPHCKKFEKDNVTIHIVDQGNREQLENLKQILPKVDIFIDDGSHVNDHQILTMDVLYSQVKDDGVYLCEDCHTSYWPEYGGGLKGNTYIEYSKNYIDQINGYMSRDPDLVTPFTSTTKSIHFYDSVVVFEKGIRPPMIRATSGVAV